MFEVRRAEVAGLLTELIINGDPTPNLLRAADKAVRREK
jgi:hypothetical protein